MRIVGQLVVNSRFKNSKGLKGICFSVLALLSKMKKHARRAAYGRTLREGDCRRM